MSISGLENILSALEDDELYTDDSEDSTDSGKIQENEKIGFQSNQETNDFEPGKRDLNHEQLKKKFNCDFCQKDFDRKFNLNRHYESRNPQECSMCDLVLCNPYDLKRHIAISHK